MVQIAVIRIKRVVRFIDANLVGLEQKSMSVTKVTDAVVIYRPEPSSILNRSERGHIFPLLPRLASLPMDRNDWNQVSRSRTQLAFSARSGGMSFAGSFHPWSTESRMDIPVLPIPYDGQECPSYMRLENGR